MARAVNAKDHTRRFVLCCKPGEGLQDPIRNPPIMYPSTYKSLKVSFREEERNKGKAEEKGNRGEVQGALDMSVSTIGMS